MSEYVVYVERDRLSRDMGILVATAVAGLGTRMGLVLDSVGSVAARVSMIILAAVLLLRVV